MNDSYDIEKRLAYLEQANMFKMMALDLSKELGDFNSSISRLEDPVEILDKCQRRAVKIIPFGHAAFYLVNENDSEFYPYRHYPAGSDRKQLDTEIDLLIEDGTFSRAVMTKEPVTAYTKNFDRQLLLHTLATASRVRGMFVCILDHKIKHAQEASLEMISVLMTHCANALESFELYHQLKKSNSELQKKVHELSESQSCLKNEILEHEKTENALEASERQYRLLAETARELIIIVSNEKRIVYANSSAVRICGYSKEDMIDLLVLKLFDDFNEMVEQRTGDDLQSKVVQLITKNGEQRPLEVNLVTIPDRKNSPGYLLVGRDISKRLEAQRKHQELESKLWRAQKMESIGLLASGIAHDFNNLLSVIGNYTALSIKKLDENETVRSHLEHVRTATDRAVNLARQLYTMGRKDEHKRVEINLVPVIKETINLLLPSLDRQLKINTSFDNESMIVLAEVTRIQQIIMNLITNAGHELRGMNGVIDIRVQSLTVLEKTSMQILDLMPGKYIKIGITDNGPGIDPELYDKIFEPYVSTKTGKSNSGLGLAVVHGIVKNYKGAVDVRTSKGQGTTFDVYLPEFKSVA